MDPCFSGRMLVASDYCQLEMRVLAHFTKDQNLADLFKSKSDFFETMVDRWNNSPSVRVKADRSKLKQVCFFCVKVFFFSLTAVSKRSWEKRNEKTVGNLLKSGFFGFLFAVLFLLCLLFPS